MARKSHGEIPLLAVTGAISTFHIQPDHWNTTDCKDNSSPKFLFLLLMPHLGLDPSSHLLVYSVLWVNVKGMEWVAVRSTSFQRKKRMELKKSDRNLTSSKPAFLVIYYWSDCDLHKTKMESDAQKTEGDSLIMLQWRYHVQRRHCCSFCSRLKFIMQKWKPIFFFFVKLFFCLGSVGLKSDRSDMYPAGYSNLAWIQQHHAALWAVSTWKHPELRAQHANPSCLSRSVGSYPAQLSETPSLICPSCYWIRLHTHKHTLTFRHGEVWRREWKGSAREEKTEEPETTTDDAWGSDRSWCTVLFD